MADSCEEGCEFVGSIKLKNFLTCEELSDPQEESTQ